MEYKIHLISTIAATGGIIVQLVADITTTANVPDNKVNVPLTFSLIFYLPLACYIVANLGFGTKKLRV